MDDDALMALLDETAAAVAGALDDLDDWGLAGTRPGQYRSDLAADEAALAVLARAGVGVLSEESGRHRPDAPLTVVIDPVDGSTNASRRRAVVRHQPLRGRRGRCPCRARGRPRVRRSVPGRPRRRRNPQRRADRVPSRATTLADSLVALSGYPPRHLGWRQFRALGAAALDLCAVACGVLDGYVDCLADAHGPWDYLGGMLVCRRPAHPVVDAQGRDLTVLGHDDRRTPVAAATPELLDELLAARDW